MSKTNPSSKSNPTTAAALHSTGQYLTFMLGGEAYAIGILAIKEIIEHGQMTRVPMMPEAIRGVINLRGAVVPVIDLGVRFHHGPTAITKRTCIVIVEVEHEGESEIVGILVDAVNEVMDIAASDIEPAPSFGTRIHTEFIAGMARIAERFVIILEPDRVLSVEEMAAVVESLEAQPDSIPANQ
jgi:purine-binding chemotaxis protein CheW